MVSWFSHYAIDIIEFALNKNYLTRLNGNTLIKNVIETRASKIHQPYVNERLMVKLEHSLREIGLLPRTNRTPPIGLLLAS